MAQTRAHVVLPEELVKQVDAVVGKRGRSKFFAEAVEAQLKRLRLRAAFQRFVGSVEDGAVPEWETSDKAAAWVAASRAGDTRHFEDWEAGR